MRKRRFVVKFCKKAAEEYKKLDNAILGEVNDALESLELRADQVGKILGKKRSVDLTGSKEKKLRNKGIRIIFIITQETREVEVLQIVEILLVDFKRNEQDLYKEALDRLKSYWKHGVQDKEDESLYWGLDDEDEDDENESIDLDELSMIDQIFNENFDSLDEIIKDTIIELYNHGNVDGAYKIWRIVNGI